MTATLTHAASRRTAATAPETVSDIIGDVIMARATHVFGLTGNANSHATSRVTATGFPYTAVRHEAGAIAAADAFHRAGGGIACATTTCGAGFTNTLTPLAEAQSARIPLVYLAGAAPNPPRPFDIDQAALLTAMGIEYFTVTPATARADTSAAFDAAEALRAPVVLLLPVDVQTAPACGQADSPSRPVPTAAQVPAADDAAIASAADLLAGARRPLIIAGRGVAMSGTADALRGLTDRLGALHMHTAMARGVLDGPWSLGTAGGFTHASRLELTRAADVVLVAGAAWNPFQARGGRLLSPDATVIHIDAERNPHSLPADLRIDGDLRAVLPQLEERLGDRPVAPTWRKEVGELPPVEDLADRELFAELGPDGRIDPRAALRRLNATLPGDRTIVTDGGHFLGWVPTYLDAPGPNAQILVGTAIQSIGLGFPSAVGAAAARRDSFTVLVTGDGGGLMALADMESFLRSARRGAVIVMNDAAYGAELHQFRGEGLDLSSMMLDDIDFAALGRSFGARGVTVRTPEDYAAASRAIEEAGRGGTVVIDVKISDRVVAGFISEILKKD